MQRSLLHSEHQLMAVGAIAFFGFPLFYWVWTQVFPQHYETIGLRLIGSFLGLGLMMTPYWPKWMKPYLHCYWFVAILYTLSFFFSYSMLKNNASVISAMSMLCAVFLLVLLVDILSLIVMIIIGWGLSFLCYYLTTDVVNLNGFHLQFFLVYMFTIIAGSVFNYKTALLQQQRLKGMAAAAGMIAHELRTPLLGIKSGGQALERYLPSLFDAYEKAVENKLVTRKIRKGHMNSLKLIASRISSEIYYANTIIDILLIKAGRENALQSCTLETCNIEQCLKNAIQRYPFQSQHERRLISWGGNFDFLGSNLLMEHVLFNLMKNALYFIAMMQKGTVEIWAEECGRVNKLHFKDTAKGIAAEETSKLFSHFHTTTLMGTGIGLSFCKLVMLRFGGDIVCQSIEGSYTEFVLTFPKLS
jgi:signal transduction histidine kinase